MSNKRNKNARANQARASRAQYRARREAEARALFARDPHVAEKVRVGFGLAAALGNPGFGTALASALVDGQPPVVAGMPLWLGPLAEEALERAEARAERLGLSATTVTFQYLNGSTWSDDLGPDEDRTCDRCRRQVDSLHPVRLTGTAD